MTDQELQDRAMREALAELAEACERAERKQETPPQHKRVCQRFGNGDASNE
jgi:hypothetical protein